jgi:hypothetical protein
MPKARRDPTREERITNEIIVDAYGPEEQAMGWYYYLEGKLHFPFRARCISKRAISPLNTDDEVEIVGMAPEDECQHEVFVKMRYERRTLAIPLSQIAPVTGTEKGMREAIEDWHYWIGQGYEL